MKKEPIISNYAVKRSIRIAVGLILMTVMLGYLLFPKLVFASQSVVSLQATLDENPSEIPAKPDQKSSNDTIQEQQLIAQLMQDVDILEKSVPKGWKCVQMRVTGYCPCSQCCGSFSDGITANNHQIQPGDTFVAADKSYPFGTEIIVPGYNSGKSVQVMDRGGAIKDNRLDLFFHTHQEALEWGVQYLDVLVKAK